MRAPTRPSFLPPPCTDPPRYTPRPDSVLPAPAAPPPLVAAPVEHATTVAAVMQSRAERAAQIRAWALGLGDAGCALAEAALELEAVSSAAAALANGHARRLARG